MNLQFEFALMERTGDDVHLLCTNNIQNLFFLFEREQLKGNLFSNVNIQIEETQKFLQLECNRVIWAEINWKSIELDENDPDSIIYHIHNLELEVLNEFQIIEDFKLKGKFKKEDKTKVKFLRQIHEETKVKTTLNWIMTNKSFPEKFLIQKEFIVEVLEDNLLETYSLLDKKYDYI